MFKKYKQNILKGIKFNQVMKTKKVIEIVKGVKPLSFLSLEEKRVFKLAIDLVLAAIQENEFLNSNK